jgi:hypothetical protein
VWDKAHGVVRGVLWLGLGIAMAMVNGRIHFRAFTQLSLLVDCGGNPHHQFKSIKFDYRPVFVGRRYEYYKLLPLRYLPLHIHTDHVL